jgi:putative FmdB family regulatory protein
MPLYEYSCQSCGKKSEEYRQLERRLPAGECKCGGLLELLVSLPANAYVSGYPYHDSVLGIEVTDPGHRRKLLKEHGLEERG